MSENFAEFLCQFFMASGTLGLSVTKLTNVSLGVCAKKRTCKLGISFKL